MAGEWALFDGRTGSDGDTGLAGVSHHRRAGERLVPELVAPGGLFTFFYLYSPDRL
jgi:hypothetical protein